MNKVLKQTLFWAPRVAGILFVFFISLFALDIFEIKRGFWQIAAGLVIHLNPSILLAVAILIAWKWEWVGAALFIGWGVFYVTSAQGEDWTAYALISGLPVLIGFLFLAGWVWRKQIRAA